MPLVTTKPCHLCGGDGDNNGQTCLKCEGSGELPLGTHAHDETEFNIKYVVEQIDIVNTKLDAMDTKMDTLEAHLDTIEAKIDAL